MHTTTDTPSGTRQREPRFVYLISVSTTGRTKIGRSDPPGRRLLQVMDDWRNASLIHLIESANPSAVESALHRRFKEKRIEGEWFALSEGEIRMLLTVEKADTPTDLPAYLLPPDLLEHHYPSLIARRLRQQSALEEETMA